MPLLVVINSIDSALNYLYKWDDRAGQGVDIYVIGKLGLALSSECDRSWVYSSDTGIRTTHVSGGPCLVFHLSRRTNIRYRLTSVAAPSGPVPSVDTRTPTIHHLQTRYSHNPIARPTETDTELTARTFLSKRIPFS